MSKIIQTAQSYWDERSELFGNYYKKPSMFDRVFRKGVYERVAVAIKACKDINNATCLDVGSGPGINSVSLIKNAKASHVTGIDFAQHMIDYATKIAETENVADKCNFILGDAITYNFNGKTFDFSMALGVFDYIENAQALINRMSELTTKTFVISWPQNGIRMMLRRKRYTCPLFHYTLEHIHDLHKKAGITNLEIITIGGGWASIAKK